MLSQLLFRWNAVNIHTPSTHAGNLTFLLVDPTDAASLPAFAPRKGLLASQLEDILVAA